MIVNGITVIGQDNFGCTGNSGDGTEGHYDSKVVGQWSIVVE